MKKLIEAGVMAAGLGLVLITLSGQTRTYGMFLSALSVILFLLSTTED